MGHMPFKGLLLHVDEIRELATEFPDTKVVIDHFGFCKAKDPDSAEWQALLGLAAFPQIFVKVRRKLGAAPAWHTICLRGSQHARCQYSHMLCPCSCRPLHSHRASHSACMICAYCPLR